MSPAVECNNLTKKFGSFTAVDDLSLNVSPGSVVGFLGPNGAGKSTSIRMMVGLSIPSAGTVRLFGADPRAQKTRECLGYVPGELRLDERPTVRETLASWGRLRSGVDPAYRDELIERLSVDPSKKVGSLSTGNRRKVALVGALMARPDLLILDEPTSGLDPLVQHEFLTILAEAASEGATIFLSSHILSEVERIADSAVVIRTGEIVADGPIGDLRRGAAQEFRVAFSDRSPSAGELRRLEGCRGVEAEIPGEMRIEWVGPPGPLLELLSRYGISAITAPEPDLETAFLSYYSTPETKRTSSAQRRGGDPRES